MFKKILNFYQLKFIKSLFIHFLIFLPFIISLYLFYTESHHYIWLMIIGGLISTLIYPYFHEREIRKERAAEASLKNEIHQAYHTNKLEISCLELEVLPESLSKIPYLQEVYLYNAQKKFDFNQAFIVLSKNKNLKSLNLSQNRIEKLPNSIGRFKYLEELNLFSNKLQKLPFGIEGLHELKYLDLSGNREIDLEFNIEHLKHLKKLEILNLSFNHLEIIPKSIQKLESLRKLSLSFNHLESLSQKIFEMPNLKIIELWNNRFNAEQLEIITKLAKKHNIEILA
jgi:Leucine-rich repeat (LRR) protein